MIHWDLFALQAPNMIDQVSLVHNAGVFCGKITPLQLTQHRSWLSWVCFSFLEHLITPVLPSVKRNGIAVHTFLGLATDFLHLLNLKCPHLMLLPLLLCDSRFSRFCLPCDDFQCCNIIVDSDYALLLICDYDAAFWELKSSVSACGRVGFRIARPALSLFECWLWLILAATAD